MKVFYVSHPFLNAFFQKSACFELWGHKVLDWLWSAVDSGAPTTLIIHDREIELISHVFESLISLSAFDPGVLHGFKLIIITTMSSWKGKLFDRDVMTLEEQFFQRVPLQNSFELSRIESQLSLLRDSMGAQVHFAFLGALFGQDGLDFSEIFRYVWNGELGRRREEDKDFCLPIAHISTARQYLENLISGEEPSFLVFLYDPNDMPLSRFEDILRKETRAWNVSNGRDSFYYLCSKFIDVRWLAKFLSVSTEHPLFGDFSKHWSEFLRGRSLVPLQLLVSGPPKSGKTSISRKISELLDLAYINIADSCAFLFSLEEETLRLNVSDEEIISLIDSIKSSFQEKYVETAGVKKNKDKSQGELRLEKEMINDSFCSTLPNDLVLQCLALRLVLDEKCMRKGYVLDVWERDLCAHTDFWTMLNRFQDNSSPQSVPRVIDIQASKEDICRHFIEAIGPQQAKTKEGQNQLKNLELSLDSYFSSFVEIGDSNRHSILAKWHNDEKVQIVCLDNSDRENVLEVILPSLEIIPGWVSEKFASDVVVEQVGYESTFADADEIVGKDPANAIIDHRIILEQSEHCVDKYQKFLLSTTVPVLTAGLIEITRNRPTDPIKALTDLLYQVSELNQIDATKQARDKFFQMLVS